MDRYNDGNDNEDDNEVMIISIIKTKNNDYSRTYVNTRKKKNQRKMKERKEKEDLAIFIFCGKVLSSSYKFTE